MSYLGKTQFKSSDVQRFDVTSSTSATHVLSWTAPNEQSLIVTINGVKQQDDAYSIAGSPTTVTLTDALITTDKLEIVGIVGVGTMNVPGVGSVQTELLADDAVTADKLANSINTEITANTAKVTNATHTGDVTGATALTIAADAVDIAMLSATGTADATTFLRGDNSWVAPSSLFSSYAIIVDEKTTGTNGGTFLVGAWRERDLQTELFDPDGIVSISSNQFTLAAGTYFISWSCPARAVGNHQSRLYNVTDAAEVAVGMSCTDGTYGVTIVATGSARTTITGSKTFSIEHQSQYTGTTYGFGYNFGLSSGEQYTMVEIFKEA